VATVKQNEFTPFFRALGRRLREQRVRHGYTQEDMISHGFSARHWQQIEAGRSITIKTLLKACATFGLKASTLLRHVEDDLGGEHPKER
jgi:transcriptional regulator with XRE-family HTH domain